MIVFIQSKITQELATIWKEIEIDPVASMALQAEAYNLKPYVRAN